MKTKIVMGILLVVGIINISMNVVEKADAPKPPAPTYYEDISPIIYNHCTSCHRTGEIGPMPLTNISEVTAYGAMVKYVTGIKYMPPWKADPDYRHFLDENVLTDAEIQTIADWYDGGMPAGDPMNEAAMPNFPTGSVLGTPDVVVSMDQMYEHQGTNQDHYQVFVLDPQVTQVQEVKAIEFRAGNAIICHHAVIGMDTTNQANVLDLADPDYGYEMYGGFGFNPTEFAYQIWAPGQTPRFFPPGMSKKIYPNSKILLQMHYAPSPVIEYDSSHINLFFAQTPAPRYVQTVWMSDANLSVPFQIPPDQIVTFKGQYTVPIDVSLLSIMPHSHLVGKSWKAYSVSSQGDTTQLIKIDQWDFNYQYRYAFQNLVKISAGSTVFVESTYDNTSSNPVNPNSPPQWVYFGDNTADEMFYCFFDYVPYQAGDENLQLSTDENELSEPLTKVYPIYPNPASGLIKFGFSLGEGDKISLGIYDLNEKVVKLIEKNKFYPKGRNTIDYNVSDLSSGTYYFGFRVKGQNFTEKFVVTK